MSGGGLLDYAAAHPCTQEPPAPAPKIRDVVEEERRAAELMDELEAKMEQASPPQAILYDAFSLIGLLAHNEEWAEKMREKLASIFEGLDEPLLFTSNDIERLTKAQKDFKEKTIRQLTRSAASCAVLEKELRRAIQIAEGVTEKEETEEERDPALDIPW